MPLIARPVSANMFVLCLVLGAIVNICDSDISAINTQQLCEAMVILVTLNNFSNWNLKEMALHPPLHLGFLCLVSIKSNTKAILLRTFIELAINPEYLLCSCRGWC